MASTLLRLLRHPLFSEEETDHSKIIVSRRAIIRQKAFLRRIYEEWYGKLLSNLPGISGPVVEVGAGGGLFKEYFPELITSDVLFDPSLSVVFDAERLPFESDSLRAVVMTDALHHMKDVRSFFTHTARCLKPGGRIAMIEPWVTPWSNLVYTRLHHEPFDSHAETWELPPGDPLTIANGALPWLIFNRDRHRFESEFPQLEILEVEPFMPFRYLLSGGISYRSFMPGWSFPILTTLEKSFAIGMKNLAMFAKIVVCKT